MKRIIGLTIAIIIVGLLFAGCEKPKDVAAKVGKYRITMEELNKAVEGMKGRWQTPEQEFEAKMTTLDNLINQKLLLLMAYKEGMDKDTTIQKRLEGNEAQMKLQALYELEIVEKVKVSDEEIKALYDKLAVEYNASHILVSDSAKAFELYQQIKNGADFAELAQKNSMDPGSGSKGGDLGWFTAGRMVKEFEQPLFALKDNEVSQPVKTQFGWHIIKRMGSRPRAQEPFDVVKDNLKTSLEREKQQIKAQAFVDSLYIRSNFKANEAGCQVVLSKVIEASKQEPPAATLAFSDAERAMPVASWDGGSWTIASFDSAYISMQGMRRPPLSTLEDVVNFIKGNLQMELLIKEADRLGVAKSDKYKENYKKSLEDMMVSTYQTQKIYGELTVTDLDVENYYNANPDSFMDPRTIVVVEIQLDNEKDAKSVYDKIKGGADMAKLVQTRSVRAYTKDSGGILELTEQRFPELYMAVSASKVDDVVGPIKDRVGKYSVMRVKEIREPARTPFDRVKGRIQSKLRRDARVKAMENFTARATQEFGVKKYEKTIAASIDSSRYKDKAPGGSPVQGRPIQVMP